MDALDTLVIGAGAVGLAVARRLALAGREVVLVEAETRIGTGVSSRSSEVIHAGIYYPPGSLRARLSVAGNRALYDYCARRAVPHRRLGKLIVATDEAQHERLDALHRQALSSGVTDLIRLDPAEARALEPEVCCTAALFSPSTGILDSHALLEALAADAEAAGAAIALGSPAIAGRVNRAGIEVEVGGSEPSVSSARLVVNCAGLGAPGFSRRLVGLSPDTIPRRVLAKGHYFALQGARSPFRHLVYPLPVPGGLGVHLTLDLAGQARFGPDVEWVTEERYDVDPARAEVFYGAIRRYWPGLPDGALAPAYAGIRPKITGPGEPAADFVIQGPEAHGVPGYVALYGIESPGLTACLAIAEEVLSRVTSPRGYS